MSVVRVASESGILYEGQCLVRDNVKLWTGNVVEGGGWEERRKGGEEKEEKRGREKEDKRGKREGKRRKRKGKRGCRRMGSGEWRKRIVEKKRRE